MAKADIDVIKHAGPVRKYRAEDQDTASNRSATLKVGEPVKVAGTGTNFVDIIATGDPEVGTDQMVGVVVKESDDTASADGHVLVATLIPARTVLRGDATTSTNVDTASELNGLLGDWVTFDVDGSNNVTIDEDEGTDPNAHGLKIVDGDYNNGTLDVIVHGGASEATPLVGQTID